MGTHGQYCPVSFAADVIGDRWTLLIMRELIGGATRFNELERCLPKVSRSLLSQRLTNLARAGLVETEKVGRARECRLGPAPTLGEAGEWIEAHRRAWQGRLDRFGHFVEEAE